MVKRHNVSGNYTLPKKSWKKLLKKSWFDEIGKVLERVLANYSFYVQYHTMPEVWKLWKFSHFFLTFLTIDNYFWQRIRETKVFTKEVIVILVTK